MSRPKAGVCYKQGKLSSLQEEIARVELWRLRVTRFIHGVQGSDKEVCGCNLKRSVLCRGETMNEERMHAYTDDRNIVQDPP